MQKTHQFAALVKTRELSTLSGHLQACLTTPHQYMHYYSAFLDFASSITKKPAEAGFSCYLITPI
jgi:hypothetical protein